MAGDRDEQSSIALVNVKENGDKVQKPQGTETTSVILPQAKLPGGALVNRDEVSNKGLRSFTEAASDSAHGNGEWWWTAGVFGRETNYGCSCSMSTFRPKVRPGDYSRLTTFVANDDASHPEQSIQAGWIRGVSGEDLDLCQVFVYFSTAGSTGGSANNVQGWNDEVTGWVQISGAFRPGHDVIPASRIDGPQGSLDLKIQLRGDRWNLRMNGTVIGYYPTSLFAANTPDQTKTLADHATRVGFFGQVYDASSDGMTPTRMGTGKYPDEGFGKSASISKMQYQPSPSSKNATMADADDSWLQINDDPIRYECRVSWKSTSWWRSYMYLGGPGCDDIGWSSWESAGGIFDPGTPVTSVSRNSTVIDLFVIGNDGKVYNSFWYDENWSAFNNNWRKLDWGGKEKFLVGSKIAAVARSPGNLDIFIIGEDFKIYTVWWSEGHDWTGYRNISGDNVFQNPQIAAISRKQGQLDVFVLSGGTVSFSHWSQIGPNSVIDWTGIHQPWDSVGPVPSTLASLLGGSVNMQVVSRTSETMEFFISGADTDGKAAVLWKTWIEGPGAAYGTWSNFTSIGRPPVLLAGSRVAALARGSDRVDVFVIDDDFSVYTSHRNTSHWDTSNNYWSGIEDEWKKIGSTILGVTTGYSNIAAVSRKLSCMDIFLSTIDGQIYTASIDASLRDAKWTEWQALGGKGFINLPSKLDLAFSAVSRNHQTLAVIGCGLNSKLWVTEWLDPSCGPRPFYCMAHNPDKMDPDPAKDDATRCLQKGANCLGPDVNRSEESGKLVISHGGKAGNDLGHDSDPDLVVYLTNLRALGEVNPQFSLIAFDCKEQAYRPDNGPDVGGDFGHDLLTAIRDNLTNYVPITIVISVAQLTGVSAFDKIQYELGPNEYIAIDQVGDPDGIAEYIKNLAVPARFQGLYGYGNTLQLPIPIPELDPRIRYSIERGVALRTAYGSFRGVYEWTTDNVDYLREYIRIGADGVMSNFESLIPENLPPSKPPALKALVEIVNTDRVMKRMVRMATREDRITPAPGYMLIVTTGIVAAEGTDAFLTFVLRGELGIAKKTVDSSYQGRMESGATDYVVMQSRDLGKLIDITVYNDMSRSVLGNSAWNCGNIWVVSRRYGSDAQATFGLDIKYVPITRPLGYI